MSSRRVYIGAAATFFAVCLTQFVRLRLESDSRTEVFRDESESQVLSEGQTYSLESRQVGIHRVMLSADDYVDLNIRGLGADIRLSLLAPNGEKLVTSDLVHRSWDREWIGWIAKEPGSYRLEVDAVVSSSISYSYRYWVESIEIRGVMPSDRVRLETKQLACRFMSEAEVVRYRDPSPEQASAAGLTTALGVPFPAPPGRGFHATAVRFLRQSLEIWRELSGESFWEGETLLRLGIAHDDGQRYNEAVEYYSQALEIMEKLGEDQVVAKTLSARGMALALLREWPKGIEDLSNALVLLDRLDGNATLTAASRTALGAAHAGALETERAVSHLVTAVREWQHIGDCWGEAHARLLLGGIYQISGQSSLAEEQIDTGNRLLDSGCQPSVSSPPPQMKGWQMMAQAMSHLQTHTRVGLLEGLPIVQNARTLFKLEGDLLGEASLGMVEAAIELDLAQQESEDPQDRARRAISAARAVRSIFEGKMPYQLAALAGVWGIEAEGLGILGEVEAALKAYQTAADTAAAAGDRSVIPAIESGRALIYRRLGLLEQAQAAIESAIEGLETRRLDFSGTLLRASFFDHNRDYYAFYLDLLADRQEADSDFGGELAKTALRASEMARARVLRELLRWDIATDGISPETAHLRKQRADLEGEIGLVLWMLRQPLDADKRSRLDSEFEVKMKVLQELDFQISGLERSVVSELERPVALGVEEIRGLLGPDEALLEYFLGKNSSHLFVVTAEEVAFSHFSPCGDVEKLVARMRQAISTESVLRRADYIQASRDLYLELIEPASRLLKGKRELLIVPDGSLFALPFEALLSSGEFINLNRLPNEDLPFLLRDYRIHYAPSAGTLAVLARRTGGKVTNTRTFLGLAQPVTADSSQSPERESTPSDRTAEDGHHARSCSQSFQETPRDLELSHYLSGLAPLKLTCRQVQEIAGVFPPGSTSVLCAEFATESALHDLDLPKFRYLHFALHGLFLPRAPDFSGLILSPVPAIPLTLSKDSTVEDGFLTVREIYRLRLSADLVALPACETGLGSVLRGEGVMGLSRAFMFAGTRSVLVCLWKVWEDTTGELMISFYKHLARAPDDKAEALRRAQLEMISRGRAHPFYWAPFILIGDD